MTEQTKIPLLRSFPAKKILIIGDVMLDEYVWGEVNRISPEAPVPVVNVQRRSSVCGGAANVAANVASLKGQAFLASVAGDDGQGRRLREILAETGVDAKGLLTVNDRPTSSKLRVIAHSQQVVRVDSEQTSALGRGAEDELLDRVEETLSGVDACAISDYGKGVLSPRVAQRVIQLAIEQKKPVAVDPKGTDFSKYRGATVVTPNMKEAEAILGVELRGERAIVDGGRSLEELLDGGSVLLTRGAEGMSVFAGSAEPLHIPAIAKNVYDVTGAGDTVLAVLTLALASGASLAEAATLANIAAGIVVGKLGTSTVEMSEL
jgi:D-beta-D-heptose 7-phosphate kinase/D-beta-D-heptose 1-phosphate adenosyltransferase